MTPIHFADTVNYWPLASQAFRIPSHNRLLFEMVLGICKTTGNP